MTKPIVIVSIVILLGLGYFASQSNQVSDVNNPETKPQTEVTNIVNDSSNNLDVKIDENKNKSEVKEEKVVINTVTGENVPEGFYDETLADGYTYNNPKPINEEWIMVEAGDNYPATIRDPITYWNQGDLPPESWNIPNYLGKEYDGTNFDDAKFMYGTMKRFITIKFLDNQTKPQSKEEFTQWFSQNYGYNFVFYQQYKDSALNTGKTAWRILVIDATVDKINNIYMSLNKQPQRFSISSRNYPLNKYWKLAREESIEAANASKQ